MESNWLTIEQEGQRIILKKCSQEAEGEIIIPDGVTDIADDAFKQCIKITSVHIPEGVECIGSEAFWGCESLSSIYFPESLINVDCDIVNGTLWLDNLPDGIVYIGRIAYIYNGTMSKDAKLEIKEGTLIISELLREDGSVARSITIPSSVTVIEEGAFHFMNCLETIKIDEANPIYDSRDNCNAIIETSTNRLLYGCKNTVIPKGVTRIENEAFIGCEGLSSIILPETVTSIGKNAFYGCTDLVSIKVDQNNRVLDSRNNCNAVLESSTDTLILGCKTTRIPDGTKTIGEYAFSGCNGLKSIDIPEGVEKIDCYAFDSCNSLCSVLFPPSLKTIEYGAFIECAHLHYVEFPEGLKEIGPCAFLNTTVNSPSFPKSIEYIAHNAFNQPVEYDLDIDTSIVGYIRRGFTDYDIDWSAFFRDLFAAFPDWRNQLKKKQISSLLLRKLGGVVGYSYFYYKLDEYLKEKGLPQFGDKN